MRTRDEINKDIKTSMNDLNLLAEASVKSEQNFEEECNDLEGHISILKAEVPFEDTLAGQIKELTDTVKDKVLILLDELEQKTGIKLELTFKR